MKTVSMGMIALLAAALPLQTPAWYTGDGRCPAPKDDGTYAAPYNPLKYPHEFPVFAGADKKGWSCSYQREDGVLVQFGDSRTPQEQWRSVWGDMNSGK